MKNKILAMLFLQISIIPFNGCKKFVEVDSPKTSISLKNVYNNDATAIGAITSLYTNLSDVSLTNSADFTSLSCIGGLSSDELTYYSAAGYSTLDVYYQNSLTSQNAGIDYWGGAYQRLYLVNSALEGLTTSTGLSLSVKKQLLGEAKFMRAFYYFYLVNLYGDIPLILGTDYTINASVRKSSKLAVYEQIIADLKDAQNLLSSQYLKGDVNSVYPTGQEERTRPTKWAASGLLARTYLYINEWENAEIQATSILENTVQYRLEALDRVYLKNNKEAIWQLQPTRRGYNTADANTFVLPSAGPSFYNPVYLSESLVKTFDVHDQRRINWISFVAVDGANYYFPYKYKVLPSSVANAPVTEYSTVMRLAEQYLIRAEARIHRGNLTGAIADVDEIRNRAKLLLIKNTNPSISSDDLLKEVFEQKRLEFFTEWGHRWLDLKRVGIVDDVMSKVTPIKSNGGTWKSYQKFYPIVDMELNANPNLTPTPGY